MNAKSSDPKSTRFFPAFSNRDNQWKVVRLALLAYHIVLGFAIRRAGMQVANGIYSIDEYFEVGATEFPTLVVRLQEAANIAPFVLFVLALSFCFLPRRYITALLFTEMLGGVLGMVFLIDIICQHVFSYLGFL